MPDHARDDLPPEAIVANAPLPLQRIAEELRTLVGSALPDAVERVRPGWGLIGYDVPNGKRTAYVAWIGRSGSIVISDSSRGSRCSIRTASCRVPGSPSRSAG